MPVQRPQRSKKPRGSQTARGDSWHALSESRKDMAKAKSSVQVLHPQALPLMSLMDSSTMKNGMRGLPAAFCKLYCHVSLMGSTNLRRGVSRWSWMKGSVDETRPCSEIYGSPDEQDGPHVIAIWLCSASARGQADLAALALHLKVILGRAGYTAAGFC